jgi:carbonic anhydrase/acetyltransferase-like protein (isoleucine patch superfamily)
MSLVAAGSLVSPGTIIPPRSLVMGRPGRVKRRLTDEEIAGIRRYADSYVAYRLDYMAEAGVAGGRDGR